ncbi:MAG: hypothetical protein WC499_00075 [Patescibacteria group bacterium]
MSDEKIQIICSPVKVEHKFTKLKGETINLERIKAPDNKKVSLSQGKVMVLFGNIDIPIMVPTEHLKITK